MVRVEAAAAESDAGWLSAACCQPHDRHRARAGHPPEPLPHAKQTAVSMSVRFVSSKKEKGEKHQRRSHNAEAESKKEHRVERGVVGQ
jgi:hypothetical protein